MKKTTYAVVNSVMTTRSNTYISTKMRFEIVTYPQPVSQLVLVKLGRLLLELLIIVKPHHPQNETEKYVLKSYCQAKMISVDRRRGRRNARRRK